MSEIFDFSEFSSFLNHVTESSAANKRVSKLNLLTKQLGYNSPRSVAMVLKKQRTASREMLFRVANHLNLRPQEREYLELINTREIFLRRKADTTEIDSRIQRARPKPVNFERVKDSMVSYYSKWYVLALKALSKLQPLPKDFKALGGLLKFPLSKEQLNGALTDLEVLGFIKFNPSKNQYENTEQKGFTTQFDVPSAAIQNYHREVADIAKQALGTQSVLDREFIGATMQIDRKRLPEAKKRLREFMKSFMAEFGEDEAPLVYQLNLQLFELGESK